MKLDVVGTAFVDVLLKLHAFNFELDNLSFADKSRISAGGNGCNLANNLAQQKINVNFQGMIGDDYGGNIIVKEFNKNNVDFSKSMVSKTGFTGLSLVLVDRKGEKSITSCQGLNDNFSDIELDAESSGLIIGGLGLLPRLEKNFNNILDTAHKSGKLVFAGTSANVAPVRHMLKVGRFKELDFLFLNAREAFDVSGINDIDESAMYILSFGVKNVIITCGDRGAYFFSKNQIMYQQANTVQVVDTTGAGDAFMSGFVARFLKDNDIESAMKSAGIQGENAVQYIGGLKEQGN